MRIKKEIATLREQDTWSLMLFALYKLKGVKEYSTLSEMAYLLPKDSVLKLCEYFGGLTIKIPTISDLEQMVDALVLYMCVDINGEDYSEAVRKLGKDSSDLRGIKSGYLKMKELLSTYQFNRG